MSQQIDLGPGQLWARPRGPDENFRRLICYENNLSFAEFIELAQVVEEHMPEDSTKREFARGFDMLKSLPSNATRGVLLHPVWIYWTRSTRQILHAWQASEEIPDQWRNHLHPQETSPAAYLRASLDVFSHMILSAHMLAGTDVEIAIDVTGSKYLSLPGTRLSYRLPPSISESREGNRLRAEVKSLSPQQCSLRLTSTDGFRDELFFNVENGSVYPVIDEACSNHWLYTVNFDGCSFEIDNRDSRILRNWVIGEVYRDGPNVRAAMDWQIPGWHVKLIESLEVLRKCSPMIQQELTSILRSIVPVESNRPEHSVSCSSRNFWGAIQVSPHPGVALAEVLAHEYRHNILNAILDADPVIDDSCPMEAIFYSPWRTDPRPLVGLLHGIYSFMEVVGFYLSYLELSDHQTCQVPLAEERIIINTCRLQVAVREFAKHAKLTRFGGEFFEGMIERVDHFDKEAVAINPSLRTRAQVGIERQRSEWLTINASTS